MTAPPTEPSSPEAPSKRPDEVGKRAIRGAAWIAAARFGSHGLSTVRLILMAWLLGEEAPTFLGVYGVAFLAMATAEAVSQTGISQAIIQKKDDTGPYLNSAWTVAALRGASIGLLLYLGAPWVAEFFDKPDAQGPLRVLALVPLLTGFNSVGVLFFSKDLAFHKSFIMQIGAAAVELVVCAVAAWLQPDVWALVWGKLAGIAFATGVSYALSDRKARFGLSLPRLKELSSFGFWIFWSALIGFGLVQGGDAVIAKLLPAAALGIYQMAARLAMLPALEIARVVSFVTFPVFSLLQDDLPRLQQAFLKAFFMVGVSSLLATACVMALAPDFVAIFLRPEWAEAAPVMQLLAIWGACRGLGAGQSAIFQASGKPALAAIFPALMLVTFAIGVVPMTNQYGLIGISALLAGIGILAQLLRYPLVAWVLKLPMGAVYMRTFVPLTAMLVGLSSAQLVSTAMEGQSHILRFAVILVALLFSFGAVLAIWGRFTQYKVIYLLAEVRRARRAKPAATDAGTP
jgi:O-antigen/teichoic acid export membrane protein